MATVKKFQVTFDCADPERVGRFWCEALGHVAPPPPPGFASWEDFDHTLPPEHQGSAFALGATRVQPLPADGSNESCLVMQDVEGNEFCLG